MRQEGSGQAHGGLVKSSDFIGVQLEVNWSDLHFRKIPLVNRIHVARQKEWRGEASWKADAEI